jgi:hypothetical protein
MAVACLKQADEIHDPHQRMTMLGVAQAYMNLASHVRDRQDHGSHDGQDMPKDS